MFENFWTVKLGQMEWYDIVITVIAALCLTEWGLVHLGLGISVVWNSLINVVGEAF